MNQYINKIHNNDCLKFMKQLPDNSVDSIVSDPPYGISFMGKKWDYDIPSVEIWQEAIRVLKPGGHALVACGTRTQHRMAVNLEDAGFEIRDIIGWLYGCLSEDTEVLTEKGFQFLNKIKQDDRICVYDIQTNTYKWEKPKAWQMYNIKQDTAYRIQSDYTDQIVSRNHRCIVEREGKFVFIQAEELSGMETVPYLSSDFYNLQEVCGKLLLKGMLRKSKRLAQKLCSKWFRKEVSEQGIENGEKSSVEGWSNLLAEARELQADKVCKVSERVSGNGKEGQLHNGTQIGGCKTSGEIVNEGRSSSSHQSRPTRQQYSKPDVIQEQQRAQNLRRTRAKITKTEYTGMIFCPTVSTGAFVARRNGKIFITGNSGFPKSLNIGKAVDKLQGNEREDLGKHPTIDGKGKHFAFCANYNGARLTKGNSPYEGWGTALKPAMELWTLCRKPLSEQTVAENVLKWGTGGINIDGCRVETNGEKLDVGGRGKHNRGNGYGFKPMGDFKIPERQGRFPANLIHDGSDEVLGLFPDTKSGKMGKQHKRHTDGSPNGIYGKFDINHELSETYGDSGSAARFFYVAKASKAERNMGLEGFEEKENAGSYQFREDGSLDGKPTQPKANFHPTIKPIKLMQYLCRLITPKGGIVLDPFCGSGSTCIGAVKEGFDYIGIELDEDYAKIARARVEVVK